MQRNCLAIGLNLLKALTEDAHIKLAIDSSIKGVTWLAPVSFVPIPSSRHNQSKLKPHPHQAAITLLTCVF
jgi:hypothetical protein